MPELAADHGERQPEVDSRPLREHERVAARDQVDEREHVRDDLQVRGEAEWPNVEDLVSHRREQRHVCVDDALVSAHDHRDVARRRAVRATGHRSFERRDAFRDRDLGEPQKLAPIVGAHVDPRRAGTERREDTVRALDDRRDRVRRRQARDDRVRPAGCRRRRIRPRRTRVLEASCRGTVEVVHESANPARSEARREVTAESTDADEADAHQPTGSSAGVRCSSSPSYGWRSATSSSSSTPRPGPVGGIT